MDFVTLEAKSHKGKNRLAEAKRRCPKWDGIRWRVTMQRPSLAFSNKPGPWLHIAPDTDENTDWISRWVNLHDDADFTVTANAGIQRAPSGDPLE